MLFPTKSVSPSGESTSVSMPTPSESRPVSVQSAASKATSSPSSRAIAHARRPSAASATPATESPTGTSSTRLPVARSSTYSALTCCSPSPPTPAKMSWPPSADTRICRGPTTPSKASSSLARRKIDTSHVVGAVVGRVQHVPLRRQGQRHRAAPGPRLNGAARRRVGTAAEPRGAQIHRTHKRLQRRIDCMDAVDKIVASIDKPPGLVATQPENLMPHGNGSRSGRICHRDRRHLASTAASHENDTLHN